MVCLESLCWALHDSRLEGLRAALHELGERGLITDVIQLPTPRGLALGCYVDATE
jgi:hypothetical protein